MGLGSRVSALHHGLCDSERGCRALRTAKLSWRCANILRLLILGFCFYPLANSSDLSSIHSSIALREGIPGSSKSSNVFIIVVSIAVVCLFVRIRRGWDLCFPDSRVLIHRRLDAALHSPPLEGAEAPLFPGSRLIGEAA
jgi:hypothetical protein